uniref:hypothetical protein n=1 Tax=Amycolatopsis sp. CA-096443 TaxID=3239919 RepID=UPI003F499DC2
MTGMPMSAADLGNGTRRCPNCGKVSFRHKKSADRHIDTLLRKARNAGLVTTGETPAHSQPTRSYFCEEGSAWHVTSKPPLPAFDLPAATGTLQDVIAAIVETISTQQQPHLFPTWQVLAEHYGTTQAGAARITRALRSNGWLRFERPDSNVTVRPRDPQPISPDQFASMPELPLPQPPSDRRDIPYVLADAILTNAKGMRIPARSTIQDHFGITSNEWRLIRRALCDLGWLTTGPNCLYTNHPA